MEMSKKYLANWIHLDFSMSLRDMSLLDVVGWVASAAMIFGGVIPYIPQYRQIRRTMSAEGFSPLVCFVLLVANLLRVFFWFGKHFELPLLAQSILMIGAMMAMVQVCVSVKNRTEIIQSKPHLLKGSIPNSGQRSSTFFQSLQDMDWRYFWKWTDFLSYVEFMLMLAAVLSLTTYIMIDNQTYVEFVGFMAVFIEAMLGTPQFYRNYINKSTEGMSIGMVGMWFCGDNFKTGYFIVKEAPTQFWVCGALQIAVDIAILSQVVYYSMFPHLTTFSKQAAQ